jgi:hypothetical protein
MQSGERQSKLGEVVDLKVIAELPSEAGGESSTSEVTKNSGTLGELARNLQDDVNNARETHTAARDALKAKYNK